MTWLTRPAAGPPAAGPPAEGPPAPPRPRPAVGWPARAYAFAVVALRYPILLGWLAAAVLAVLYLPSLAPSGGVADLIPRGSPAVRAEIDATRLFRFPLSAPVAVVQADPHRLPLGIQAQAARNAAAVDRGQARAVPGLAGALPVANTGGLFPGSRQRSTTVITFLYFRPGTSIAAQAAGGQAYARRYAGAPRDHLAGVTGPVPARYAQGLIIARYLPWVEAATLAAIALIVGLYFRSVGAPLATLLCAATGYLLAVRVVAWTAARMGVLIPPDLEPVLVVLLLGVTTDYSVFFLTGMRTRLAEGLPRLQAARLTTAEYAPIILTAGLVVAAGTAALAVAHMQLLRAFGPGLALTVLTAMAVSMTLAPALIAIFGGLLFRPLPAGLRGAVRRRDGAGQAGGAGDADGADGSGGRARWLPRRRRAERPGRLATARPLALVVVAACVASLAIAAWGVRGLRLGSPLIGELPASAGPSRAAAAAARGFVPGILSPTEVLVLGPGVAGQAGALGRLQRELARAPGTAAVVGPASLPPAAAPLHLMVARTGDAARFAVIERTDPLGPVAVGRVRALQRALPSLARSAGLTGVRFEVGGESALTAGSIDATAADIGRIALAVLLVTALLLAVFLRALLAPVYLLAASVLALVAALGVTVWVFQGLLGYEGLVYYVPFAVAVLLVSLGSDYNVFVVGRIWEEARRRPLREAVAIAAPRASRAITIAGLALAASFALLAVIPLAQFRELAAAMAAGVLIDALVVRSMLVPALVTLFGRAGRWPGGQRESAGRTPAARAEPGAGAEPVSPSEKAAAG
ncbi:MAG: MMPL family transporter [Gemmatimonadota bacterium]